MSSVKGCKRCKYNKIINEIDYSKIESMVHSVL